MLLDSGNTTIFFQRYRQMIRELQTLKAQIEWDFSIEYQILLDEVIQILGEMNEPEDKK
jgi:hypothetical protein